MNWFRRCECERVSLQTTTHHTVRGVFCRVRQGNPYHAAAFVHTASPIALLRQVNLCRLRSYSQGRKKGTEAVVIPLGVGCHFNLSRQIDMYFSLNGRSSNDDIYIYFFARTTVATRVLGKRSKEEFKANISRASFVSRYSVPQSLLSWLGRGECTSVISTPLFCLTTSYSAPSPCHVVDARDSKPRSEGRS